MNKLLLALFAIPILFASAVSIPHPTEAQNESATRSSFNERYGSISELRTYMRNRFRDRDNSTIQMTRSRTDGARITKQFNTTPPSLDTTPTTNPTVKVDDAETDTTTPTQPETILLENEVESVVDDEDTVVEEEAVNNVSTDTLSDEFMMVLASEIHRLTNIERERAGVPMLGYDIALATIATGHSEDMAVNDYFSHTAEDGCTMTCRFDEAGYTAQSWAENIAWYSSSKLPEAKELAAIFVEMWMDSEGHRHNMLSSKYTREGIGLARSGDRVYATANFANPL